MLQITARSLICDCRYETFEHMDAQATLCTAFLRAPRSSAAGLGTHEPSTRRLILSRACSKVCDFVGYVHGGIAGGHLERLFRLNVSENVT